MNLFAWIAWIIVAAVVLALVVYLRFALGFWAAFQFKACPNCGSKRSRFLGHTHLEPTIDFSAYRCRQCSTEFVIADDVLRDVYVRGKHRDVILPMTVLRRLDAVLEPNKQAVTDMKAARDREGIANQDNSLRAASGQEFYNTAPYRMRDLKSRATQQALRDDFVTCFDGFSPNVQDGDAEDGEVGDGAGKKTLPEGVTA